MKHEEFVEAYKSGQVAVQVHRGLALRFMRSSNMPKRSRVAHLLWTWLWFLSFPVAIGLIIWVKWWVGLLVLLVSLALFHAIRESAYQSILEYALDNEEFYELAVKSGVLIIAI